MDPSPPSPASPAETRQRLAQNVAALAAAYPERGNVARALTWGALTRTHTLLVSPPGTAKSALVEAWRLQWQGARYAPALFTADTKFEDVVGSLDVKVFAETGRYVYDYSGRLADAEFCFLDECYKANRGALNALLSLLNERRIDRAGVRHHAPLIAAVLASNELPEAGDALGAFDDRVVQRFSLDYIADRSSLLALLTGCWDGTRNAAPALEPVTLADLSAAQADVEAVKIPVEVAEAVISLTFALRNAGVPVSDRRQVSVGPVLKAAAWWDGASEVDLDHLEVLADCLWVRPEQRDLVVAAIAALDKGPIGAMRAEYERGIERFHTLTAERAPDGSWTSPDAQRAFAREAPALLGVLGNAAQRIRALSGDATAAGAVGVPPGPPCSARVKARALALVKALGAAHKVAHEACRI
jgi:MoxR-like ATPase